VHWNIQFMPAKDRYHDTVVRALIKDGWTIASEQVRLRVPGRRLWVDIRAVKADASVSILVEVKGFENAPSQVEYLAGAVGK
jgi:ribulose bisphosphate carboxylase small subunit